MNLISELKSIFTSRDHRNSQTAYSTSNSNSNFLYSKIEKDEENITNHNNNSLYSTDSPSITTIKTITLLSKFRRLMLLILLPIILINLIFFTTFKLSPNSLPSISLKLLSVINNEDLNIFSTRYQFCQPLILENKKQQQQSLRQGSFIEKENEMTIESNKLPRKDWANLITGTELLGKLELGDLDFLNQSNSLGITPLIHTSWKTHSIPSKFLPWSESWRSLNSKQQGWTQVIWSDEDNLNLISKYYGEYEELYLSLPTGIHKADFSRNFYMHKFGGIYADLDLTALLPVTSTLSLSPSSHSTSTNTSTVFLARMGSSPQFPHSLPNAFFSSTKPNHPFWLLPIEFARKEMIKQTGGKSVGKSAGGRRIGTPEGITGPVGVHASERVWREMERDGKVGSDLKVVVLDQNKIFPFDWNSNWGKPNLNRCLCWGNSYFFNESECKELFPKAGAVTFWTKSWAGMVNKE